MPCSIPNRSLIKNKSVIVLKPNYEFLMWKLPSTAFELRKYFSRSCNPFRLFTQHYLEAHRLQIRSKLIIMEIQVAWDTADGQIRREYEMFALLCNSVFERIPYDPFNGTDGVFATALQMKEMKSLYGRQFQSLIMVQEARRNQTKKNDPLYFKKLMSGSDMKKSFERFLKSAQYEVADDKVALKCLYNSIEFLNKVKGFKDLDAIIIHSLITQTEDSYYLINLLIFFY